MNNKRVLVTPRSLTSSPNATIELLSAHNLIGVFSEPGVQPSEDELAELLPGCAGWIAGVESIGETTLNHADVLRVISRYGSGLSNVDLSAAQSRNISVVPCTGTNSQGVADLALAHTLNCLRSISLSSNELRTGSWARYMGREIHGLSIVVVGLGAIGRRYAFAMRALGARISAVDPIASETVGIRVYRDLRDIVQKADVVSLHCPPAPDGIPLIGDDILNSTLPGLILINTARAELVNDDAVLRALASEQLSFYALDTFRTEPPPLSELLLHPRVIATPHIGGLTTQSMDRTLRKSVKNIVEVLNT